jgi:hypothetical protein
MLRTITKCIVVLAGGGLAAAITMLLVFNLAANNGSRWPMTTSWTIAALSLSVTIGGWWVNRSSRGSKAPEPAAGSPVPSRIRQDAENARIRGGRNSVNAANINNSTITVEGPDSSKSP